jgi:hypothetical protein
MAKKLTNCPICNKRRRRPKRRPYGLQQQDKSAWCGKCDMTKVQDVNKKAARQASKKLIQED